MRRVYHHYKKWEDFKAGMYSRSLDEELDLKKAIEFTGNHDAYGLAMKEVVEKWKFSCEHNLTNLNINRKAWLGHAACSFKMKLPEYIVRSAWGLLTEPQRILANAQADKWIEYWEANILKKQNRQLSLW